MNGPTLAGFTTFVYQTMAVPTAALPVDSLAITYAYNVAFMTVNPLLGQGVPCPPGMQTWSIYALAVYNLAGDRLINFTPDQPMSNYFATLRGPPPGGFGLNAFVAGNVEAAADESTSDSLVVPDFFKTLTLSDLQSLRTPWGREYLSLAQAFGPLWGLTI